MDPYRLTDERKRRKMTVTRLCKAAGISRSAYYRKMKGASEFTQGEMQRMIDLLGLESPMGIFFPEKCLKRHKDG